MIISVPYDNCLYYVSVQVVLVRALVGKEHEGGEAVYHITFGHTSWSPRHRYIYNQRNTCGDSYGDPIIDDSSTTTSMSASDTD